MPAFGYDLDRDPGKPGHLQQVAQLAARDVSGHVAEAGNRYQEARFRRVVAEQDALLAGHAVSYAVGYLLTRHPGLDCVKRRGVALGLEQAVQVARRPGAQRLGVQFVL